MPRRVRITTTARFALLAAAVVAVSACSGPGWRSTPIEPGARSVNDYPPPQPERGGGADADTDAEPNANPPEPNEQTPTSQPTSQPTEDLR